MSNPGSGGDDVAEARLRVTRRLAAIDEQLAAVAPLTDERDRLREALRLLGEEPDTASAGGSRSVRPRPAAKKPRAARAARRGDNRERLLSFLQEHPGAEAGALVEHLGVSRGVAYNLLGRLVKQEVIVREPGDSNRSLYRIAEAATDES